MPELPASARPVGLVVFLAVLFAAILSLDSPLGTVVSSSAGTLAPPTPTTTPTASQIQLFMSERPTPPAVHIAGCPGGLSASQIDGYLSCYGSPLAGHGATFVSAGQQSNVDPRLIVAIAGAESSFGKNLCSAYNAWNWFYSGWCTSPFSSWDNGINTVTAGVGNYYLRAGQNTIYSFTYGCGTHCYCPSCGSWYSNVRAFYAEQGGNPDTTDLTYFGNGGSSPPSTFTPVPSNNPGIPTLLSPDDGISVQVNQTIHFSWSNTGASQFKFEAWNDTGPGGTSPVVSGTSYDFAPGSTGNWRWQVRSILGNGQPGDAPPTRSFTVNNPVAPSPTPPTGTTSDCNANGLVLYETSGFDGRCITVLVGTTINDATGQWYHSAHSFKENGNWWRAKICTGTYLSGSCANIPDDFGPNGQGNLDNQSAHVGGNIGSLVVYPPPTPQPTATPTYTPVPPRQITVDDAWTNDDGGDKGVRKATFQAGDQIAYVGIVNNQTGDTATASFVWDVHGPGGSLTFWSGDLATGSGSAWWWLSATVPPDAVGGSYSFSLSVTWGGQTFSHSATFTVVGPTPTPTMTRTRTPAPSPTPTRTPTSIPTATPTRTATPTPTATPIPAAQLTVVVPTPGATAVVTAPDGPSRLILPPRGLPAAVGVRLRHIAPPAVPTAVAPLRAVEINVVDTQGYALPPLAADATVEISYADLGLSPSAVDRLMLYNATRGLYLLTTIDRGNGIARANSSRFSIFVLVRVDAPIPRLFLPSLIRAAGS